MFIAYPNAYSLINKWGDYIDAVTRAKNGEIVSKKDFGILASVGLSAGGFLVSPFATDGVADIQLTVFPVVNITT